MKLPIQLRTLKLQRLLPGLDILALLAWGLLLLTYWRTGKLYLLIHPNYFWLVFVTSLILLALAGIQGWQMLQAWRKNKWDSTPKSIIGHITLFPPGWGSTLLLTAALAGFFISPTVFASQVALQRGVTESLPQTQEQPQAFRSTTKPEQRSLIDWIRTLNAYPEPDAYAGQKATVSGFVVHLPQLPENYLLISRFILTCCAVDAYPVGLPVKLPRDRSAYPADSWLEIEGEMMTETLSVNSQTLKATPTKRRQLVLVAKSLQAIPTPFDPYSY